MAKTLLLLLPALCMTLSSGMAQEQEPLSIPPSDLLDLQIGQFHSVAGVAESSPEFEQIVKYVRERIGLVGDEPAGKITLTFMPADRRACQLRGLSVMSAESPSIEIFVANDTSRAQIAGVLAHELGHMFQFFGVQGGRSVDGMFNEGYATWAAGRYWLEWQGVPSFEAAVRDYLDNGTYLPLRDIERAIDNAADMPPEECLLRRDTIYTEWGAFIDFLMKAYGRSSLDALLHGTVNERSTSEPQQARNLPNYAVTYGMTLEQLEADWLSEIRANE